MQNEECSAVFLKPANIRPSRLLANDNLCSIDELQTAPVFSVYHKMTYRFFVK